MRTYILPPRNTSITSKNRIFLFTFCFQNNLHDSIDAPDTLRDVLPPRIASITSKKQ